MVFSTIVESFVFLFIFSYDRQSRTTFDTAENRKEFGPIVVDYAKVRTANKQQYSY